MADNKLLSKVVVSDDEKEPIKKKTKLKIKGGEMNKNISTQYSKYSGIVDENGKSVDNPTVGQSMKNMVQYLKNNTPESNVYRPEHIHTSILYNKKKPISNA